MSKSLTPQEIDATYDQFLEEMHEVNKTLDCLLEPLPSLLTTDRTIREYLKMFTLHRIPDMVKFLKENVDIPNLVVIKFMYEDIDARTYGVLELPPFEELIKEDE
jgi:hypothetical protein